MVVTSEVEEGSGRSQLEVPAEEQRGEVRGHRTPSRCGGTGLQRSDHSTLSGEERSSLCACRCHGTKLEASSGHRTSLPRLVSLGLFLLNCGRCHSEPQRPGPRPPGSSHRACSSQQESRPRATPTHGDATRRERRKGLR